MAATVMANGAMSVQSTGGDIRKSIIEDDLLDAVIALPKELFFTTSIPACIYILTKGKKSDQYRDRSGETLFVDAREEYESIGQTQNILEEEHINRIVEKVRAYRGEDGADEYEDEKGFCKVAEIEDIADNRHIITPGRYVGIKEQEGDDEPFEVKMERLSADLRENFQKSNELQDQIEKNLEVLGF
jgi:type I restriction enzyme M protein